MLCRFSTTFKWTAGCATPNTVQGISRCWRLFSSDWYEAFQKHSTSNIRLHGRASGSTAQFFSRCWRIYLFGCFAVWWIHSSFWLGRVPQHLLSRLSSLRGVEKSFCFDVTWIFNNVSMNGWSCYPKYGPALITVLKNFFVWMVWSFSKTLKSLAEPYSPIHGPVLFTVLKNHFLWIFCSHSNTFKLMAGPRSPTSPVTAQLILQRRRIISFWCCAAFQQRSNEWMLVFPQTRSCSFHDVEKLFRLNDIKRFKNIRCYGWVVLLLTRPSSFHGVERSICMDVLQPCKNIQVYGWAALLNILCHGPAHLATLKNHFVLILCRLSTTFKWTAGRAPPNTVQGISRCWKLFLSG